MSTTLYPIPVGPSNAQLVTGFIQRCRQADYDFCPSDPTASTPASLCFYHVPRTGGTRFALPIRLAFEALASGTDNPLIAHLHESSIPPFPTRSFPGGLQDLHGAADLDMSLFAWQSQRPYGVHHKLNLAASAPPLASATILRHPEQRLRSALISIWLHHGQNTSSALESIAQSHPILDNPITRLFSGNSQLTQRLQPGDVDAAVTALSELDHCLHQTNFSPVRRLQQSFISGNRLPNLLIPAYINKTSVQIEENILSDLERISIETGHNRWDEQLYDRFIQAYPPDLEPASFSINALHPLTFILPIHSCLKQEASFSESLQIVRTLDLLLGRVDVPTHDASTTLTSEA